MFTKPYLKPVIAYITNAFEVMLLVIPFLQWPWIPPTLSNSWIVNSGAELQRSLPFFAVCNYFAFVQWEWDPNRPSNQIVALYWAPRSSKLSSSKWSHRFGLSTPLHYNLIGAVQQHNKHFWLYIAQVLCSPKLTYSWWVVDSTKISK